MLIRLLSQSQLVPQSFFGWLFRSLATRDQLQAVGAEWLHEVRSCVLAVPSVVMPAELNYLINPLHPDFPLITLGAPEALELDLRLLCNLADKT